jgi:hypothetical protein
MYSLSIYEDIDMNDLLGDVYFENGDTDDVQHQRNDTVIHTRLAQRPREYRADKMTVVISSYKQPFCLERQILLLRSCSIVEEIRVNWFEEEEPILYNEFNVNHPIPVIFDKYPDKLSYRFYPRDFRTDGVFSVDADVFYSCESLAKTFRIWKENENAAVGYHGRFIKKTRNGGMYQFPASYRKPDFKHNTIFVTKGGITHKSAFDEFFKAEYKDLRDLVDKYTTAEDILMSFLLEIKKTKILFICAEEHSTCQVQCKQNKLKNLNVRTASHRTELFAEFFTFFGKDNVFNVVDLKRGYDSVIWEHGKPEEHCYSYDSNEYDNTPHCVHFCTRNLICPSSIQY